MFELADQTRLVGRGGAQTGDRRLWAGHDAADTDCFYRVDFLAGRVLCGLDAGLRRALDDGFESPGGYLSDRFGRFGQWDERDGRRDRHDYRDISDRLGFRPLFVRADPDRGQFDSAACGGGRAHARPQQPRDAGRCYQPDLNHVIESPRQNRAARVCFRDVTPADIAAGLELCRAARWNQTERDWELFLQLSPEGCRVAVMDERVVGTVATAPYEDRFAWIGM